MIGENTFRVYAKEIATFLNLPNADQYTSHSFRVSGATAMVNSGATMLQLKSAGNWKSDHSAQHYFQNSDVSRQNTAKKLRLDDNQSIYSSNNSNLNSSSSNAFGFKSMNLHIDLKNARNCNITIGNPFEFDNNSNNNNNNNNKDY